MIVEREYPYQWAEALKTLDMAELARLRRIEGWSCQKLANHFKCSTSTIFKKVVVLSSKPSIEE